MPLARDFRFGIYDNGGISYTYENRGGVEIWPFPLLWIFVFTTGDTAVRAVMKIVDIFYRLSPMVPRRRNCTKFGRAVRCADRISLTTVNREWMSVFGDQSSLLPTDKSRRR